MTRLHVRATRRHSHLATTRIEWSMAMAAVVFAAVSLLSPSLCAQITSTTVTLSWTAKGDDGTTGTASQYDLRYSTSTITASNWASATQVSGEPTPKAAGQTETFTVTGLTPSTTYYFALKVADEVPNWSALSNVVSRTTLAESTPPSAIANLAVGTATTSSLALSWTSPGDDGSTGTASQYDLRYSTSAITAANFSSATAVTGLSAPKIAGSAETFSVTGLAANTTYYFAIKTADEVPNWATISNIVNGKTNQESTAPATIANLGAGSETSTSVQLTWTAPGDDGNTGTASQYDVRYSTSVITAGNFSSATAATGETAPKTAGSVETFTVGGLSANTTYYFAVKTADEVPNWSAISNVVSRLTSPEQIAPSAVTTLAALNPTPTTMSLTWTAVGDDGTTGTATQYEIRYSTSPITSANFTSATLVSTPPTPKAAGQTEMLTISGLTQNTTYYFALKVADEVPNWSGLSNVATQTTTASDVVPPDPVNDLSAAPGTNLGEILLSWTATGDDARVGTARVYEIRYSLNPINISNFNQATLWTNPPIPLSVGSAQSVVLTGLTPGSLYRVAMKTYDDAANVAGLSNVTSSLAQLNLGTSTEEIATLVAPAPGSVAPSSRPTLVVDNILSSGPNTYYFEVASDSSFIGVVAYGSALEQSGQQTDWQVPNPLSAQQTYYWRVRANSFGYSDISTFSVMPQTHAYPNPFRPTQTASAVITDIPTGSDLILASMSGETVRQWTNVFADIQWDGTNAQGNPVASGVYLWTIENSSLQGKIIVIR